MAVANFSLPPWLAVSNTMLMPEAMQRGAQTGATIAAGMRQAKELQLQQQAQAEKAREAAIRFTGYQDYQADVKGGMKPEEAIKKNGVKMFYGSQAMPSFFSQQGRLDELTSHNTATEKRLGEHNEALQEKWKASEALGKETLNQRDRLSIENKIFKLNLFEMGLKAKVDKAVKQLTPTQRDAFAASERALRGEFNARKAALLAGNKFKLEPAKANEDLEKLIGDFNSNSDSLFKRYGLDIPLDEAIEAAPSAAPSATGNKTYDPAVDQFR